MFLLILLIIVSGLQCKKILLLNLYHHEIWLGIHSFTGEPIFGGGLILQSGDRRSVDFPDFWSGYMWGRTGCNNITDKCLTGDCCRVLTCSNMDPPPSVTTGYFSLDSNGTDIYFIALNNGYNLPLSIEPIFDVRLNRDLSCQKIECHFSLKKDCPPDLKVKKKHRIIGCTSLCLKYKTDQYCCKGDWGTTEKCKSYHWEIDYQRYFKDLCPYAYTYPGDYTNYITRSHFLCSPRSYVVTFGRM